MRGSTTAALVFVSVTCWPTIGAMLLSEANKNASNCRRIVSPSGVNGMPSGLLGNTGENGKKLKKRNTVSILPS